MNNTKKAIFFLGALAFTYGLYLQKSQSNPKTETAQDSSQHLKHLQDKLNEAVEREDYEEACRLRDKINSIQTV